MQKGFTLIEFMIILVIITILAVIAIPAFIKYSNRQQETQSQSQSLNQAELARLKEFNDEYTVPINGLIFYREPRVPDFCIAYGWVGDYRGGPVGFEVNCEKVAGLLINPLPNKDNAAAKPSCPPDCPKQ